MASIPLHLSSSPLSLVFSPLSRFLSLPSPLHRPLLLVMLSFYLSSIFPHGGGGGGGGGGGNGVAGQSMSNRYKWIDRIIRLDPGSPAARDGHATNLAWTPDAKHLYETLPFPFLETLDAFTDEALPKDISPSCFHALVEFKRQLGLGDAERKRKRKMEWMASEEENDAGDKKSLRNWALKSKCFMAGLRM